MEAEGGFFAAREGGGEKTSPTVKNLPRLLF